MKDPFDSSVSTLSAVADKSNGIAKNGLTMLDIPAPGHMTPVNPSPRHTDASGHATDVASSALGAQSGSSLEDAARTEDVPAQSQSQSSITLPLAALSNIWNGLNGAVGWMNRVHSRTQELCRWFGLPETEMLLDEFHCALRKRVLLQGRIYVFDHYVCFSSFVFGFAKKKVMPFQAIVAVKKKTHLRFPNSIEIELQRNGSGVTEKQFFTSFLSREDAFRLIDSCWQQARPGLAAQAQDGVAYHSSRGGAGGQHHHPQQQQQHLNHLSAPVGSSSVAAAAAAGRGGHVVGRQVSLLEEQQTAGQDMAAILMGGGRRSSSLGGVMGGEGPHPCTPTHPRGGGGGGANGLQQADDEGNDDEDEDDEGNDEGCSDALWSSMQRPHPAPAAPSDAKLLFTVTMPGTPRDFFNTFLADESHFLEDFWQQQGNKRISILPWQRHEQLGHVRDVQFVAPIKGAFANWGVPHTQCYQSHRLVQYAGQHLVFENSQTMTDIPYGDCFTVEQRWDILPVSNANTDGLPVGSVAPMQHPKVAALAGADARQGSDHSPFRFHPVPGQNADDMGPQPEVTVQLWLRVPFSRRCMFRKIIENGTKSQVSEQSTTLLTLLRDQMEAVQAAKCPPMLPPSSATLLSNSLGGLLGGRGGDSSSGSANHAQQLAELGLNNPGAAAAAGAGAGGMLPSGGPSLAMGMAGTPGSRSSMTRTPSMMGHHGGLGALDAQIGGSSGGVSTPGSNLKNIGKGYAAAAAANNAAGRGTAPGVAWALGAMQGGATWVWGHVQHVLEQVGLLQGPAGAGSMYGMGVQGSSGLQGGAVTSGALRLSVLMVLVMQLVVLWSTTRTAASVVGAAAGSHNSAAAQAVQQQQLRGDEFWATRVGHLQQELSLLQRHLNVVASELSSALVHLGQQQPSGQ